MTSDQQWPSVYSTGYQGGKSKITINTYQKQMLSKVKLQQCH